MESQKQEFGMPTLSQTPSHSSNVFNLYLERVMLEALEGEKEDIEISGVRYTKPRYADDIVVAAVTSQDMQTVVQKVEEQCKRWKPEVN